jgi:hypothetical protein
MIMIRFVFVICGAVCHYQYILVVQSKKSLLLVISELSVFSRSNKRSQKTFHTYYGIDLHMA